MLKHLKEYAELVRFEHTIFALPFTLSAVLLASGPEWPNLATLGWVIAAMVGGRTYAMGLNRILDAGFDAQNPRTASRGIPAGRVSMAEAWTLTLLSLALLVGATIQLPLLCLQLLPLAIGLLSVYSLMKRFSSAAHLVLGLCLGSAAIAGWLAVTGQWSWWAFGLGLTVALWVMGFDLIYACQDIEVDRRLGLHSVPASLGIGPSLHLSKLCHGFTLAGLAVLWWAYPYSGWPLWVSWFLMAAFLVCEHQLISPNDLSKVNAAFFTANGWISITVLLSVIGNQVWLQFR